MLLRFPRDERRSNRRFARSDVENDVNSKFILFSIFFRHQQEENPPRDRLRRLPGHEVPRLYDGLRRVGGADGRWTRLWRVHGLVAGDVRKKVNNFFYFVTYLLSYGRPVKHVKLLLRDIGQGTPATLTRQHSLFSRW